MFPSERDEATAIFVFSLLLGIGIGFICAFGLAAGIVNSTWQQWCLDQGYASYDAKTGVLIYVEKEE